MSIQAMAWAIQQQIVKSNTAWSVLMLLANCADADGRNAFPSIARLAREARLSARSVQKALRDLEEMGVIRPGDQRVAAAYIGRGDRRPTVYDIVMDEAARAVSTAPEEGERGECAASREVVRGEFGAPREGVRGERGAPRGEATGCRIRPDGVQPVHERGESPAPDPSMNPSENPSIACARESLGGVADALRRLAAEIGPRPASSWISPLRVVSHDPPIVEAPNRWHAERIRQDFGGRLEAMLGRRVGIVAAETGAPRAPGVAAREARR